MASQLFPNALLLKYPPENTSWQEFTSLFGKMTVLKVLRGFECPLTKQESFELTQYHACFEKMDVTLMAVCEQSLGGKGFLENGNWNGELYLDLYQDVCRPPLEARISSFLDNDRIRIPFRKKPTELRSLFQLGGTYIISPGGQIVYAHEPKFLEDTASTGLILYLCRSIITASKSNPSIFIPVSNTSNIRTEPAPAKKRSFSFSRKQQSVDNDDSFNSVTSWKRKSFDFFKHFQKTD